MIVGIIIKRKEKRNPEIKFIRHYHIKYISLRVEETICDKPRRERVSTMRRQVSQSRYLTGKLKSTDDVKRN